MNPAQDVSNLIFQIVNESPAKTVLGVRLGAQIKRVFSAFSPFNYQCRNLREFVKTYVPQVVEQGHSGTDVIYTIAEALPQDKVGENFALTPPPAKEHSDNESETIPISAYAWKAYANPSSPLIVATSQSTGEIRSFHESNAMSPGWVVIPKASAEFHKDVATAFVSTLPEPLKAQFLRILSDRKWYVQFSAHARRSGIGIQWASFRKKKLIAEFNATLRNMHVPLGAPSVQSAVQEHALARISPSNSTAQVSEEARFRALVQAMVAELPISELRLLRLPVGIVFDAMKQ